MTKKNNKSSVSYEDGLVQRLKDPEYAAAFLNAILSDKAKGLQTRLLTALQSIAKAHGMTEVSKSTKLQKETLRKALSEKGNPTLFTLFALLKTFGIQLRTEPANAIAVIRRSAKEVSQELRNIQEAQIIYVVETQDDTTVSQTTRSPYKSVADTAATVSVGVQGAKHVH